MNKHRLAPLCSILLLAALLVSLTVPLASAYSDVTHSAFPDYFDAINYVTDNGLMNGTSSTQFEPNSFSVVRCWSVQYGIRSINFAVEKKSRTILCITALVSGTPNLVEQGNHAVWLIKRRARQCE